NPENRSFNCSIPMPFRSAMKIVVINESEEDVSAFYYDVNYTIGDKWHDNVMYFHSHWRRERETTILKDYEFLPKVIGKGRFLGLNCGVIANTDLYFKSWWGEGECKIFLDGDEEYPTLCGTGTEDYIGTAWGQGQYAQRYQGCHIADAENNQYAFYRYHIADPIYFHTDIRVSMHQIGCWGPHDIKKFRDIGNDLLSIFGENIDLDKAVEDNAYGLFERSDDWSSCAYFYLDQTENNLPEIAAVAERTVGLLEVDDARTRLDA
ncbi:MAG: DUF2961 domain-containing protein, partial [Planctomycetes bacterium]|nr:DUF2961 domain-containing protein [Planctomycetota bacterium]